MAISRYRRRFHKHARTVGSYIFVGILTLALIFSGVFQAPEIVSAATYTWTQSNWSGGTDGGIYPIHTTNQTGWTAYGSKDSGVTAGSASLTQSTSTQSSLSQTTDSDFGLGTNSSTTVSGSGSSASVGLTLFTGLTGYWKFDEASGTTAADSVGSNTMTLTGSPTFVTAQHGNGISFNGSSQYAQSGSNLGISGTSARSVAFWAQSDTTASSVAMVSLGSNTTDLLFSAALQSSKWKIKTWSAFDGKDYDTSVSTDTSWHFHVVTYDGTVMRWYRDGSEIGPSKTAALDTSDQPVRVGSFPNNTWYFDGIIDDLRIYSRVLSAAEISGLANSSLSGTFTSGVIDTSQTSLFTTLSFNKTTPANTTLTVDVRAGSTATPDGTWTSWQTNISSNGSIGALGSNRYVQYRANLSSSDSTATPTLDDVTINYIPSEATLISSAYNSADSTNTLSRIAWSASTSSAATVKFQLRTAPNSSGSPGTWTSWMGPDGSSSTYFTDANGGETLPSALRDGANDQWFQYKAIFTSTDITQIATLTSVTVTYVVNAAPELTSVSATQNSDGTVTISYSARDSDTSSGTATPGYVTPSFEYSVDGGSTYTSIASGALGATALSNKAVGQSDYTAYTATWNASTTASGSYDTDARIRVTVNDNEGANNTVTSATSNFTLDTKVPTVNGLILNGGGINITLNATDDSNISYRLSNDSDVSPDGSNATSGQWQSVGSTSTGSSTITWTFSGNYPPVYLEVKDAFGNQTNTSSIAPRTPQSYELRDISNVNTAEYKELINWGVYSNSSGATFASYKIYRSTDSGSTYSLHSTITDQNLNYYIDTGLATTTTYYYKVQVADSNGDTSAFTPATSDTPNGQGGTDVAPPAVSSVTSTSTQSTAVTITWTTDELSNSTVEYSTDSSFNLSKAVDTMVTSHSVTLTGLTPATAYRYRVKSADIFSNTTTDANGGSGYTLTTSSGPVISNVTTPLIGDTTATVSWNTNSDSNSYVVYANNSSLTNSTQVGSSSLVGASASSTTYTHSVEITGLTAGSTYYFYVKSTDGSGNTTTDNNGAAYYSFRTTQDVNAPTISSISTPVIGSGTVVIVWLTNELSDSQVTFGTASTSLTRSSTLDTTLSISHIVTLTGLSESTTYYYQVISQDQAGNEGSSSVQSFTTTEDKDVIITTLRASSSSGSGSGGGGGGSSGAEIDTVAPSITNITSDPGSVQATISWQTNELARSFVALMNGQNVSTAFGTPDLVTNHAVRLTNLRMGTEYSFIVKSDDKSGNVAIAPVQRFKTKFVAEQSANLQEISDLTDLESKLSDIIESSLPSLRPPVMSDVAISNITESGATFMWRTNLKGSSLVALATRGEYHPDTEKPYSIEQSGQEDAVTHHTVKVQNLTPNTLYHYQVRTKTLLGTLGASEDATFSTKAAKAKPVISGVTNSSFIVSWTSVDPTTSIVEYTNTSTGALNKKTDARMVKNHEMLIEGLPQGVMYDVVVSGVNTEGNTADAESVTVKTSRDSAPPTVSNFKVESSFVPGRADRVQTVISWQTDELATALVEYNEGSGASANGFANKAPESGTLSTMHTAILFSLKPQTLYELRVTVTDEVGNKTVFGPRTIITPKPAESIVDVIFDNFEDTFKFIKNINP